MKEYTCLKIFCPGDQQEIVMAVMNDEIIEVFEETPDSLLCYMQSDLLTKEKMLEITQVFADFSLKYELTTIPYINWNETWESNFHPIQVHDFVGIRADFHPAFENVRFDLIINPKMAFGTGHHETTFQMIDMMQGIDFNNKKVLDYGCGTGILGIVASKLGAAQVSGNDITDESILNTIENCKVNHVNNFKVELGELELFKNDNFDIILANINRNVLQDSAITLSHILRNNGILLLSGYMPEDQAIIEECFVNAGFKIINHTQKGYWLCHKLTKQ